MTGEVFNCLIIKKVRGILWIGTNFPLNFSCLKNVWRFWSRIMIPWRLALVTRGISYYNLRFLKKNLLLSRRPWKRLAPIGPKSKSTGCLITLSPPPLSADALWTRQLAIWACVQGDTLTNKCVLFSNSGQVLCIAVYFLLMNKSFTVISAHIVLKLWTKTHLLSFKPRKE